jgi:ribosomal protein S6--L-glutamate ligase
MHLAVLGSPDSWYLNDLRRAAESRHEVTALPFSQLASKIVGGREGIFVGSMSLARFDAVLVRSMPPGSLEQVVFRMDLLGRAEAIGITVMNPPRAVEAAVDKFLATAKLQAAGLRVPKTIVCQTADDALAAFAELGGDVVIKPLFGSEGRGIARLQDEALALRAFRMLERLGAVLYV